MRIVLSSLNRLLTGQAEMGGQLEPVRNAQAQNRAKRLGQRKRIHFHAASLAEGSQWIQRVTPDHTPQFGDGLVWREIGVDDYSNDFVCPFDNFRT
jgi:hypothetical protein